MRLVVFYVAIAIDAARGVHHEGMTYARWTQAIDHWIYLEMRDKRRERWQQLAGPLVGDRSRGEPPCNQTPR